MRKTCLLLSAVAFACVVNAATYTVEDFENKKQGDTLVAWNYADKAVSTTATATVAANPNGSGNVAQLSTTGWNNLLQLEVTLPTGKTIANYEKISFDFYWNLSGNDCYKIIRIYADTNIVYWDGANNYNKIANQATWTTKSYTLDETVTSGNTFQLAIGIEGLKEGTYYIDNIQLEERESASTVLTIEDYESKATDDTLTVWDYTGNTPKGTAKVITDPVNSGEKCAQITVEDYNNILQLTATLPTGQTIANYEKISFDFYWTIVNYKKMRVYIDDNLIYNDTSYISQGNSGAWTNKSYSIPESTTSGNTITIAIGLEGWNSGSYCIDNIKLTAREGDIPTSDSGENLLPNGDFENGTTGWVEQNMAEGGSWEVVESTDAQNGSKMLKIINANTGTNDQYKTQIQGAFSSAMVAGTTYTTSLWVKSDTVGTFRISYTNDGNANYSDCHYQADENTTSTWKQYSYTFTAGFESGAKETGLSLDFGQTAGTYYVDNIIVAVQSTSSALNMTDAVQAMQITNSEIRLNESGNIMVYNMNGQILINKQQVETVDLSHLAKGIYIVKAIINQQIYTQKLSK